MNRKSASSGGALLVSVALLTILFSPPSLFAATGPSATPVLVDAMDSELHRAMSSLGTAGATSQITSASPSIVAASATTSA